MSAYFVGQEIVTGTHADAQRLSAGDTGTITDWLGTDLATYEIVKVDKDRGLIYGVIVSVGDDGRIPAAT